MFKMNFCQNCGEKRQSKQVVCSCIKGGYCTTCGTEISENENVCNTCANAYTHIITCECYIKRITVKCPKCGTDPIPMTLEEFDKYRAAVDKTHRELNSREYCFRQKKALLKRLVNNIAGGHCTCSGTSTCSECYASW